MFERELEEILPLVQKDKQLSEDLDSFYEGGFKLSVHLSTSGCAAGCTVDVTTTLQLVVLSTQEARVTAKTAVNLEAIRTTEHRQLGIR